MLNTFSKQFNLMSLRNLHLKKNIVPTPPREHFFINISKIKNSFYGILTNEINNQTHIYLIQYII